MRRSLRVAGALCCAFLAGCTSRPSARVGFDENGHAKLSQIGPVEIPAAVSVSTSSNVLKLPRGSRVRWFAPDAFTVLKPGAKESPRWARPVPPSTDMPGREPATAAEPVSAPVLEIELGADAELRMDTRSEHVEGPKSYAPPSPPSPESEARGKGILAFWWVAAGLAGVCVVGAIVAHFLTFHRIRNACLLGAVGVPLAAKFFASIPGWLVVVLVLAGAVFAYLHAWHVLKPRPPVSS